jgi:hypothetical protein
LPPPGEGKEGKTGLAERLSNDKSVRKKRAWKTLGLEGEAGVVAVARLPARTTIRR